MSLDGADGEQLEVVSPSGESTGELVARSTAHRDGLLHKTVYVLLHAPDGSGDVLLQQRHPSKAVCGGLWDVSVAEHCSPGESYEAAAHRGLAEELGVAGVALRCTLPPSFHELHLPPVLDRELVPLYEGTLPPTCVVSPDGVEVAAVRWVPWAALLDEAACFPHRLTPWLLTTLALCKAAAPAIRRAVSSDAPRLVSIVNAAYRGDGNWTHERGLVAGPRVTKEDLDATLAAAGGGGGGGGDDNVPFVLVAELPGFGVVGCIECATIPNAAGGRDGYLGMLAVASGVGSRGIGGQLVTAGEAACVEHFHVSCCVMWVLSVRNDILAWYARRGYAPTGERAPARDMIEAIHSDAKLLADGADFVVVARELPAKLNV